MNMRSRVFEVVLLTALLGLVGVTPAGAAAGHGGWAKTGTKKAAIKFRETFAGDYDGILREVAPGRWEALIPASGTAFPFTSPAAPAFNWPFS